MAGEFTVARPKRDTRAGEDTEGGKRRAASADADAASRKEKMLHARIPESLDREIKRRAGSLGMSVSTIVRHVLLNTFNLVEDVVADGTNIALSLTGERSDATAPRRSKGGARDSSEREIIGWQEAVLNLNAVCDRCNAILAMGTRAAIAIGERSGPRTPTCCAISW